MCVVCVQQCGCGISKTSVTGQIQFHEIEMVVAELALEGKAGLELCSPSPALSLTPLAPFCKARI